MIDMSLDFDLSFLLEVSIGIMSSCISLLLALRVRQSALANAARPTGAAAPGRHRRNTALLILPLYEPIMWLAFAIFTTRTCLLAVPGPFPTPPGWYSGAVDSTAEAVETDGAITAQLLVHESHWLQNSALYFLYWFLFEFLVEGVALFFVFPTPSGHAIGSAVKYAALLALALAVMTTIAFNYDLMNWSQRLHTALDCAFFLLPCALHGYLLLRPACQHAHATRSASITYAAFNLFWRSLSAASIAAGISESLVGAILKVVRAGGTPLVLYVALASDSRHWLATLKSVMTQRQVLRITERSARGAGLGEDWAIGAPLPSAALGGSIPPSPAASPPRTAAFRDRHRSTSLDMRGEVGVGGGSGVPLPAPPPSPGSQHLRRTGSGHQLLQHGRRRLRRASYALHFLDTLKVDAAAVSTGAGGAGQRDAAAAATGVRGEGAGYGSAGLAVPLLAQGKETAVQAAPRPRQESQGSSAGEAASPHLGAVAGGGAEVSGGGSAAVAPHLLIPPHDLAVLTRQELGRGANSRVYRGRWRGREVAVKRVLPDSFGESTFAKYHSENVLLSALRHSRIIKYHGMCMRPPYIDMVFAVAQQGSLWDFLHSQGPSTSLRDRLRMGLDAARAVRHLHTRTPAPIVHRDIKSPNFLVQTDGRVLLADFGQATALPTGPRLQPRPGSRAPALPPAGTATAALAPDAEQDIGTVAWVAPEVLQGTPYGLAVDIYSLGIVLWEVATASRPFADLPTQVVLREVTVKGARPHIPPDLPPRLAALLESCWHADPACRPSADTVCAELKRIAAEVPEDR